MDRVANAVEALAVTLLLGLLTGALDGLFADPVAGESLAQRMGAFALLDAVGLLPVGLVASLVAMGASRRARKPISSSSIPIPSTPRPRVWSMIFPAALPGSRPTRSVSDMYS